MNNIITVIGDFFVWVAAVIATVVLLWLYLKFRAWLYGKKHPDSIRYSNRFADEEDAMNAFLNPHDPILNPQPNKPEKTL